MEDERDCDEAIRSLDGQVIQGQKLAVERAKSSGSKMRNSFFLFFN